MKGTERKDNARMPAWAVWKRYWVRVGGDPLLDRRIIVICPLFGIFWTQIHAPDEERDPHDHSRTFLSLIVNGGYAEDVWADPARLSQVARRQHRLFSVHMMHRQHAHRIVSVRKPLRTLVIAGRWRQEASFWTPAAKIPWKDYG